MGFWDGGSGRTLIGQAVAVLWAESPQSVVGRPRDFCEVAIAEDGAVRSAGRVDSAKASLELFAGSLTRDDVVAMEATADALAIARLLEPHVARVMLANPKAGKLACRPRATPPASRPCPPGILSVSSAPIHSGRRCRQPTGSRPRHDSRSPPAHWPVTPRRTA